MGRFLTEISTTSELPISKLTLHRPIKAWVQVTSSCNLKCKHCYGDCPSDPAENELSHDELIALGEEMSEAGVIELLVEGGEPLNRPDLSEILGRLSRTMLIRLRTNATLLTAPLAQRLKTSGVAGLAIDFMGATAETHDWHYGREGSFERAWRGLRIAQEHGLKPVALIILTRRNLPELQGFIDLAAQRGVTRVGILRLYPLGRAKLSWDEMSLSVEQQTAAVEGLTAPAGVHLMRSWHPRDGNCCWQASGVDAFGRSVGCSYLRDFVDFGNVRETTFLNTWNHPLFRQLRAREVEGHCTDCESTQGSAGGCRSTAYAYTGNWNAPDPFCTTMNRGVDVQILPSRLLHEGLRPPTS